MITYDDTPRSCEGVKNSVTIHHRFGNMFGGLPSYSSLISRASKAANDSTWVSRVAKYQRIPAETCTLSSQTREALKIPARINVRHVFGQCQCR